MSTAVPVLGHDPEAHGIPKIVHQVWVGSTPPNWVLRNWERVRDLLPDDWEHKTWTEENSDEWPLSRLLRDQCKHAVILADLIRLEQVYKHGGIYLDSDTLALRYLDSLVGDRGAWVSPGGYEGADGSRLNNSMFGAPPRHRYMADIFNHAAGKVATLKNAMMIGGPVIFEKYLRDDVEVLPLGVFPDLPVKMRKDPPTLGELAEMFPNALGVHTANKSWFGSNHSVNETPTYIMAVPWVEERKERAHELAEETRGKIVWDEKHDAFHTWRRVLAIAGDRPAVIVEDDVVLGNSWRTHVENTVEEHPDDVIQFFSMRGKDLTEGSRYEPGRTFLMNQCYYLPAGAAVELLWFTETWQEEHPEDATGYDVAMAAWMRATQRKYWLRVPSLVQHEPWRSEINPRRPRNRQSMTFEATT